MTRAVRQIKIAPGQSQEDAQRPFSDFGNVANIVLLGDPGAGKSHLFRQAATAERGYFIRARDFLNVPATKLTGQALFIDGLDEKRAGRGDKDTIDRLVVKLFEVNPSKLRISCRVADWLGESDLAAMAPFFDQHGDTCVLHLESLSRDEQIAVLSDEQVESDEAQRFIHDAVERGLDDFVDNPQNLLMLWRAVQTGSWPATRSELFELSTRLMLQESNGERARSGSGTFSAGELRATAGAICAARLISDIEAIDLRDQDGSFDIPGYRSMSLSAPEKVQSVLGRRVFDAGPDPETVDYAHRTMAEFLAAEFLAARVREGLPFGRVEALIGVRGHPASELRGLHAWLAVHLPEHADELIKSDPYGVLAYGDAASLSRLSCAALVRALDLLSRKNPWFRSDHWQAKPIGALARLDMVGEFRAILNDPTSEFSVRSVVLDALASGTPLPAMLSDLQAVLVRGAAPFSERTRAFEALFRLGDIGKNALRTIFAAQLGNSVNDLRLRVAIVQALYADPYGPSDVVALVNASPNSDGKVGGGMLFSLAKFLPEQDLPAVLDGIVAPAAASSSVGRESREAGSFYTRILARAWPTLGSLDRARVMSWLYKRAAFRSNRVEDDLRAAIRAASEWLRDFAEDFFDHVLIDENRWFAFHRFREATLFELDADSLAAIAAKVLDTCQSGSERQRFLYEVALSMSFQIEHPRGAVVFDELYQRGEDDKTLRAVRDVCAVANLPANFFAGRLGQEPLNEENRARQRVDFDKAIDQIRNGQHLGWLKHLAWIYFGIYDDVGHSLSERDRISEFLGEERVTPSLEALAASLSRDDVPTFDNVMALAAEHQHYDWWFALVAGLNERWVATQSFGDLSDDSLKGLLAFDVTNPVWHREGNSEKEIVHPWRTALMEAKPELVRDTYLALARLRLSRKDQYIDGFFELLNEPRLEQYRPATVLDLLERYPNADSVALVGLLDKAIGLPVTHETVLQLARPIVSGEAAVDQRQADLWLATAYVIAPGHFESRVRERSANHPTLIFDLRDRSGFNFRGQQGQTLPLPMLEFMARLTGTLVVDTPYPTDGWSGDKNPWDASEYFRSLVNAISASPSSAATDALERLEANPQLASYRSHVLYALASQRQRQRESEYDRPNWPQTIAALGNGAPATVADLHALLVAQMRDLAHRIARSNTDIFKQFWNVDAYARLTEPRPEDVCRDAVVTLLKSVLLPLGVTVEPETHMVADKRADISVAMPGRKILCELKRDYHAEVWSAAVGQLERFYAHDPQAKGFGIYVVFWFGVKRPRPIPAPPNGVQLPTTPAEMEALLQSLLPENSRKRLTIIVFDVSGEV